MSEQGLQSDAVAVAREGGAAHLLGRHAAAEEGGGGEVAAVAGVGGAHHVLGVPHLLRQLGHAERAVLLAAAAGQGREAHHEEVQPGEGDQIHCQLAQVGVQLACAQQPLSASLLLSEWRKQVPGSRDAPQLSGNPGSRQRITIGR